METKLTKKELLEQLAEIEKKELELKNELFYDRYNGLSFLQIWKKSINWKTLIILVAILESFIWVFDSGRSVLFLSFFPIILTLGTISIPLEIYQKMKILKKQKGE